MCEWGMEMEQDIIRKAGEIISNQARETGYCTLALIDEHGYPTVSTISASKSNGINWITFCTGLGNNKTERIGRCNRAGVCFNSADYDISLVGTIEIVTDPDIKKEMWYGGLNNHFNGPEDPNYCVLRFTTKRYNLLIDWKETAGTL